MIYFLEMETFTYVNNIASIATGTYFFNTVTDSNQLAINCMGII